MADKEAIVDTSVEHEKTDLPCGHTWADMEEGKVEIVDVLTNKELLNIENYVLEIEQNILSEASNIVNISTCSSTDQTMFLQPIDFEADFQEEAAKVVDILTYDDGAQLEEELEVSAHCLEKLMPRTQSELELQESEDSESDVADVLSDDSIVIHDLVAGHSMQKRNNFKYKSGESTDSDLDFGEPLKPRKKAKSFDSMKLEQGSFDSEEVPNTDSEFITTDSEALNTDSEVPNADTFDWICSQDASQSMTAATEDLEKVEAEVEVLNQAESEPMNDGWTEVDFDEDMIPVNYKYSEIEQEPSVESLTNESSQETMEDISDDIPSFNQSPADIEVVIEVVSTNAKPSNKAAASSAAGSSPVPACSQPEPGEESLTSALSAAAESLAGSVASASTAASPPLAGERSAVMAAQDCSLEREATGRIDWTGTEEGLVSGAAGNPQINVASPELKNSDIEETIEESKGQSSELRLWLLDKEMEFDQIMGGGETSMEECNEEEAHLEKAEFDNAIESETLITPKLEESRTDLMDELELQTEILKQITENALLVSGEDGDISDTACLKENNVEKSVYTEKPVLPARKNKSKSKIPTQKSRKKIPKSPLLNRSEIKTCIDLHNACENAEILQELIGPAISFGRNDIPEAIPDLRGIQLRTPVVETPFVKDTVAAPPATKSQKRISIDETRSPAVADRFSTVGMAWFPWKTISFLLLISTAAIINLDLERSGGNFKDSNTGQFLSDIGQYERVVASSNWVVATTKHGQAWAEVQTRQGREWAEITLPVYWAQGNKVAGPYLDVAGAKAGEVGALLGYSVERVQVLARSALASAEAAVPGLQDRLSEAGVVLSKWGEMVVIRAREVGLGCREGVLRLVNGEVDWSAVKTQVEEGVTRAQEYLVALFNYVRVQVKHLVK